MMKLCNEFTLFCLLDRQTKISSDLLFKTIQLFFPTPSWQTGCKLDFKALTCKMYCICQPSISRQVIDPVCPIWQSKDSTHWKRRWEKAGLRILQCERSISFPWTCMQPWRSLPDHAKQQNSRMSQPQTRTQYSRSRPNKHFQTSHYSNTYCVLLLRYREQNQTCFLNTPYTHSFFSMSYCLQLLKKTTLLPSHSHAEFPAHHCQHHLGLSFELGRILCH